MPATNTQPRDYAMFDAELTGAVLNVRLLGRLLDWLRPYAISLVVSAALVLLASTMQVLLPVVIALVVIDGVLGAGRAGDSPDFGLTDITFAVADVASIHPLWAASAIYVALLIGSAAAAHAHRLTLTSAVVRALRDLRLDLFRHLETRPSSFYDQVAVGRVMTRVTNDIEALFEMLRGLGALVGEFVPFFVALGIMLSIDVTLTLILLLALPLMGTVTYYFRNATRRLFRLVRSSLSALNQNMQENLAGLQVVQISERQAFNSDRYRALNTENRDHELHSAKLETLYGAFTDSIAHLALAVVLYYGANAIAGGSMTLGEAVLFTRFIDMLFHPIVALGEQTNVLFRAMASGERIFQALDWDEAIHEPANPVELPPRLRGSVRFAIDEFAYRPGIPVLQDVRFEITAGETLAIVGPTGSGKSTLIRLLGRFYDFPNDQIFLDDIDLNRIHTRDLRRRVGVVLQDFHIFSGSLYDNIALGDPRITREDAIAAAQTVNAHGFIERLPNGYDTQLAERGQNLSQGQRQLLLILSHVSSPPTRKF